MKTLQLTDQQKELIQLNASSQYMHIPGTFDKIGDSWGYIVDFEKISDGTLKTIDRNIEIITELKKARDLRSGFSCGDYLQMPDGTESRITHIWEDSVQDGGGAGSFYLCKSGNASYSGGLDGGKDKNLIKDTGKTKTALFWIFSENSSGAGRSFYFYIDVKVWKIENMFKTVCVKFEDYKYNYTTSINGKLSDEEVKKYFVGKFFNLGTVEDDMQKCIDCAVYY